ncbi:hypothetical protein LCGC14_0615510 [marine sediment metagenome]|uniref:Dihydrodipicolinate synthase n=1 Tax=marine sediment metagenome TaxID=412755 RepID=A0A0F9UEV0_9ZZZZ|nr:hypothetical protein [Phycisphaerae bacterium]HDZ42559.1 hypothetical protein [Phycisphaerae bacterium]
MSIELSGLVAAVFTPMRGDGALNLAVAGDYVSLLAERGVGGILPCGTTGQFPALSVDERQAVAEAFVEAAADKMPVVVHVGCDSIDSARRLAAHAADIGADAIAALPPSYLKPPDLDAVVDWYQRLSEAAPQTPLFYYHIPSLTGVELSVLQLLRKAIGRVATLAGVKYTHEALDEYALCVDEFGDRLQILFGRDETLLSALVVGATGAIGSCYNFASPLYRRLWDAFNAGDLTAARKDQLKAIRLINTLKGYGYPAASKSCMKLLGIDCGPPRPPFKPLTAEQESALGEDLTALGLINP